MINNDIQNLHPKHFLIHECLSNLDSKIHYSNRDDIPVYPTLHLSEINRFRSIRVWNLYSLKVVDLLIYEKIKTNLYCIISIDLNFYFLTTLLQIVTMNLPASRCGKLQATFISFNHFIFCIGSMNFQKIFCIIR